MKDVETVGEKQLQEQEVVVGDETGKVVLVLWGDKIGCLQEQKSYRLHRVQVSRYGGKAILGRVLHMMRWMMMCAVRRLSRFLCPQWLNLLLVGARVLGVQNFEVQFSCISCKALIESSGSSEHAISEKCNTGQVLIDSRVTAKLILQNKVGTRVTVRAVLKWKCE